MGAQNKLFSAFLSSLSRLLLLSVYLSSFLGGAFVACLLLFAKITHIRLRKTEEGGDQGDRKAKNVLRCFSFCSDAILVMEVFFTDVAFLKGEMRNAVGCQVRER